MSRKILPLFFCISVLAAAPRDAPFNLSYINALLDKIGHSVMFDPPVFSSEAQWTQDGADLRGILRILDEAVVKYPNDTEVLFSDGWANHFGQNLGITGCEQKRFKSFERLVELKPDGAWANYEYGTVLAEKPDRKKDSIRYLEKALSLNPNFGHGMLARIYTDLGDKENALRHWKEELKFNPSDKEATKRITEMEDADFRFVRREEESPKAEERQKNRELPLLSGHAARDPKNEVSVSEVRRLMVAVALLDYPIARDKIDDAIGIPPGVHETFGRGGMMRDPRGDESWIWPLVYAPGGGEYALKSINRWVESPNGRYNSIVAMNVVFSGPMGGWFVPDPNEFPLSIVPQLKKMMKERNLTPREFTAEDELPKHFEEVSMAMIREMRARERSQTPNQQPSESTPKSAPPPPATKEAGRP